MQIDVNKLKVGDTILSWDDEDKKWYRSEVKEIIDEDNVVLEDLDLDSFFFDTEWRTNFIELKNIKQFRQ